MKRFKPAILIFLAIAAMALSGCALFQKPPVNPDEKTAWIEKSQAALDQADLGESAAFIFFGSACAAKQIDARTCAAVGVADQEWKKNYGIAQDSLAKYKTGEITQAEAQRLLDKTLLESLKNVMAALMPANRMIQERAVKARSGDLGVPTGQTKEPPKK
jgi:hypothetical protein